MFASHTPVTTQFATRKQLCCKDKTEKVSSKNIYKKKNLSKIRTGKSFAKPLPILYISRSASKNTSVTGAKDCRQMKNATVQSIKNEKAKMPGMSILDFLSKRRR